MGSAYNLEESVQCPYFVIAKATVSGMGFAITCEGIGNAEYNTTRFKKDRERQAQLNKYCCADYRSCPIAKAIEGKYL